MNPLGHQTLPALPRPGSGIPRSQSSRGSAGTAGLGVAVKASAATLARTTPQSVTSMGPISQHIQQQQHQQQQQQLSSMKRVQHQHAKHFITQTTKGGFTSYTASRVNDLPDEILHDRAIQTSAHEDHRRRTIIVERDQAQGGSFGFTLQTYGIRHRDVSEIELITYVDSVEPYGSAARAGMRAGDVILSINGQDVESVDHNRLIQMIQACGRAMRVVVLFEDCVRRVALHVKLMQLKRSHQQKVLEYNHYVEAERNMLETLRNKGVNTDQLLKGSTELLPLASSSSDVLFPFRKHSKSFNRLSVSHSKSESRLLSDSTSNLASSSGRRPTTNHRDTSASCSTLPRLGGRRSSARSLPASAAVTPVGSLDGLEQGSVLYDELAYSPSPPYTPAHSGMDLTRGRDLSAKNRRCRYFNVTQKDQVKQEEEKDDDDVIIESLVDDMLDQVCSGGVNRLDDGSSGLLEKPRKPFLSTIDDDHDNVDYVANDDDTSSEDGWSFYKSVYARRDFSQVLLSCRSRAPLTADAIAFLSSQRDSLSLRLASSDSGIDEWSVLSSCPSGTAQFSRVLRKSHSSVSAAAASSPRPPPPPPRVSSLSKLPDSTEFAIDLSQQTLDSDPSEGASTVSTQLMAECFADLDATIRLVFCIGIAISAIVITDSVMYNTFLAILYVLTIVFLGM